MNDSYPGKIVSIAILVLCGGFAADVLLARLIEAREKQRKDEYADRAYNDFKKILERLRILKPQPKTLHKGVERWNGCLDSPYRSCLPVRL